MHIKGFLILIVHADPYSMKPLKETDQDPGCSNCMKRCHSCKNFADHISSFECFTTTATK